MKIAEGMLVMKTLRERADGELRKKKGMMDITGLGFLPIMIRKKSPLKISRRLNLSKRELVRIVEALSLKKYGLVEG